MATSPRWKRAFTVPLDNERRWYRYHHLSRDLLRQRLNQPRGLPEYHLRASAWFEANADLAQAFQHALAAGDFERAARLAEAAWQDMERSFHTTTWLGWVKQLPNAVVSPRPWLCVQIGWAFSDVGEPGQSETYLQTAELAIELAPERDAFLRSQAAITLGFTHWTAGRVEASLQAMRAWMNDMQNLGNHMYMIASAFAVADMQVILGRLGEAGAALLQTIEQAAAYGQEAESVLAHHHLGLAMLAYERGDDAAFAQSWQTAARLGQGTTLIDWPYRWNLAQARLRESDGEWDSALGLLDVAERAYVKNPIPILRPIGARKARIYLKQGRLDKAQAWARECGLSVTDEASYLSEYDYLTLARVRMAEGSFSGLHELLGRLLTLAESQHRMGSVVEILLPQGLVHQAQDALPHALAALERALTLTAPERWIRAFLDEGDIMRTLISAFQQTIPTGSHTVRDHVDRILDSFPQTAGARRRSKTAPLRSGLVAPLTERELDVLRLIAAGRSNADIGRQLYLALSTVKGHNLCLFGKLQAQNRTEAVARARELGLL